MQRKNRRFNRSPMPAATIIGAVIVIILGLIILYFLA